MFNVFNLVMSVIQKEREARALRTKLKARVKAREEAEIDKICTAIYGSVYTDLKKVVAGEEPDNPQALIKGLRENGFIF